MKHYWLVLAKVHASEEGTVGAREGGSGDCVLLKASVPIMHILFMRAIWSFEVVIQLRQITQ